MNKVPNVFISYNINDNEITDSKIGWVTEFSKYLKFVLKKFVGDEPVIFTTEDKSKNTDINASIIIASNDYFNTAECLKECKELADQKGNQLYIVFDRHFEMVWANMHHEYPQQGCRKTVFRDMYRSICPRQDQSSGREFH